MRLVGWKVVVEEETAAKGWRKWVGRRARVWWHWRIGVARAWAVVVVLVLVLGGEGVVGTEWVGGKFGLEVCLFFVLVRQWLRSSVSLLGCYDDLVQNGWKG